MAEDYTTYTEVDTAGELTVISNRITFTGLAIDEAVSVGKDFGVDNFGDFIHKFKVHIDEFTHNASGQAGTVNLYSLCDTELYTTIPINSSGHGLVIYAGTPNGSTYHMTVLDVGASVSDQYASPTPPYDRWLEVEKSGTTITVKIYSDAFSTLVDTLTITGENITFRYLGALGGYEQGGADPDTATGYVEDLDLDAAAALISSVGTATYADASKVAGVSKATIGKIAGISV